MKATDIVKARDAGIELAQRFGGRPRRGLGYYVRVKVVGGPTEYANGRTTWQVRMTEPDTARNEFTCTSRDLIMPWSEHEAAETERKRLGAIRRARQNERDAEAADWAAEVNHMLERIGLDLRMETDLDGFYLIHANKNVNLSREDFTTLVRAANRSVVKEES